MACFRPAANDRAGFDKLLTGRRTTGGRRSETTFAGLAVGQKDDEQWTLLDSNSASDSDLWIARALLEAGRLWQQPQYTETGKACWRGLSLKRRWRCRASARCCCREKSVLPMTAAGGLTPAIFRRSWPPTLCVLARGPLRDSNLRLLLETAPKGFTPDWVR